MTTAAFAIQFITLLPSLIDAGIDVYDIVKHASDKIKVAQDENRELSDADWDELHAKIISLRAERDQATADLSGA